MRDATAFEAYVTHLGKHAEGNPSGIWIAFPSDAATVQAALQRIGINHLNYEEIFITDYAGNLDFVTAELGEHESLDELNYLAYRVLTLDETERKKLSAILQVEAFNGVDDLINCTFHLDDYWYAPDIGDEAALGAYYVYETGSFDTAALGELMHYFDYEAYGQDIAINNNGTFLSAREGYISRPWTGLSMEYSSRADIPAEYIVTQAPTEVQQEVRPSVRSHLSKAKQTAQQQHRQSNTEPKAPHSEPEKEVR